MHDVGEQEGVAYLVMQYLEGETLAARLARASAGHPRGSGLSFETALTIAVEIVSALDRAHRAGVIHRDLKPGNVMLTPTGAKLLDFGIAKSQATTMAATGLSMLPTTPPSLTAQGAIVGSRAGRHSKGRAALGSSRRFSNTSPRRCRAFSVWRPRVLDRLVRTCLDKNPDNRRDPRSSTSCRVGCRS